ncbi:MAG TPA: RNA polymerase subunit sigma-24 [Armatimonadetes bacterium]|jgi:RNA polymerase sigma-70 factor (ECF subfamily)|nr:RNA polymerase subunit sigma-24 [Armatimonadota bacterium]
MDEARPEEEQVNAAGVVGDALQGASMDSDEALVRSARQGDFGAFERLFERHRVMVFRIAYRMTGRRDDAEDITQDAFLKAYQNLHRYRDEARFTTWLVRIVTNLATDRARMANRRHSLEQQEAGGALDWMTVGTTREDPSENLEREQMARLVQAALAELPPHHRLMIVLRDLEEKDYQEIAGIVGTTVGGVKLRVLRARRALRDKVNQMLEKTP